MPYTLFGYAYHSSFIPFIVASDGLLDLSVILPSTWHGQKFKLYLNRVQIVDLDILPGPEPKFRTKCLMLNLANLEI